MTPAPRCCYQGQRVYSNGSATRTVENGSDFRLTCVLPVVSALDRLQGWFRRSENWATTKRLTAMIANPRNVFRLSSSVSSFRLRFQIEIET